MLGLFGVWFDVMLVYGVCCVVFLFGDLVLFECVVVWFFDYECMLLFFYFSDMVVVVLFIGECLLLVV